jgi:hypothetical protein
MRMILFVQECVVFLKLMIVTWWVPNQWDKDVNDKFIRVGKWNSNLCSKKKPR